jgi:hypothetical protein
MRDHDELSGILPCRLFGFSRRDRSAEEVGAANNALVWK